MRNLLMIAAVAGFAAVGLSACDDEPDNLSEAIEQSGEELGEATEDAAERIGEATEEAAEKATE